MGDLSRATRKAALEREFTDFLANRELALVDRLVALYRAGDVDHDKIIGVIGAISEIRTIEKVMEKDTRNAIAQIEKEQRNE